MLGSLCLAIVGFTLLIAGLSKMRDVSAHGRVVMGYKVLPDFVAYRIGTALPIAEVVLGAILVLGMFEPLAGYAAGVLFSVYATGLAINLVRGRTELDCGCFGFSESEAPHISWFHVLRAVVLIILSVFGTQLPPAATIVEQLLSVANAAIIVALIGAAAAIKEIVSFKTSRVDHYLSTHSRLRGIMTTVLIGCIIVLSVALVLAYLMIFGLAREIGRVQVRLGPLGARVLDSGPKIGESGPSFEGIIDQFDRTISVGGMREKPQLLMFMGPNCSTCRALLPGIKNLAKTEPDLEVVIVSDGSPEEHEEFLASAKVGSELSYVDAREVGIAYEVGTTPYGVLLDITGTIAGKGLCNNMQHVESLLNALEENVPTLQHLYRQTNSA